MTSKEYVVRAANVLNLDLIAPTRGNPGVLAYANINSFNKCVVDALTWADARAQINVFAQQRAA